MNQTPVQKKRQKPRAGEMTDTQLAKKVFGKRLKKQLDKVIEDVDNKGVPDFMKA